MLHLSAHSKYLVPVADDHLAEVLRDALLKDFPSSSAEFFDSLPARALTRLASLLYFLPSFPGQNKASCLFDYLQAVQLAGPVLHVLATSCFGDDDEQNEDDFLQVSKRKKNQWQSKQGSHRGDGMPRVDRMPFQKIGENVPSSSVEAEALGLRLLEDQRRVLQVGVSCGSDLRAD